MQGAFCHACGQKAVHADVSLHDLAHEAFHEFAHLDGKIVQTLRILVTKPGLLTVEFLSGRRARYLSPIRLYLTCSLLFFGLAALAPDVTRSVMHVSRTPSPGEAPLDPVATKQWQEEASARMGHAIVHDLPRVMFALMPVFGVLTFEAFNVGIEAEDDATPLPDRLAGDLRFRDRQLFTESGPIVFGVVEHDLPPPSCDGSGMTRQASNDLLDRHRVH